MRNEIVSVNDVRGSHKIVRVAKAVSASGGAQMFVTEDISSQPDYLLCRTWDGVTLGESRIAVARPPRLRQTPFDGAFDLDGYNYDYDGPNFRIKSSGTKSEQQVIVPAYVDNRTSGSHQIIFAIRANTGLVESDSVGPIDDAFIVWQDVNADGRAWAKKYSAQQD